MTFAVLVASTVAGAQDEEFSPLEMIRALAREYAAAPEQVTEELYALDLEYGAHGSPIDLQAHALLTGLLGAVGGHGASELLEHSRADLEQFLPSLPYDSSSYSLLETLGNLAVDLEAQCLTSEAILWLETLLSVEFDWRLRGDALNQRARLLADAADWGRLGEVMREHEAELDAVEKDLTPVAHRATPPETTAQAFALRDWSRLIFERARFTELRGIQHMELGILDLAAADLRVARDAESFLLRFKDGLGGKPDWLASEIVNLQDQVRAIRVSLELQLRLLARRFGEAAASALAELERLDEASKLNPNDPRIRSDAQLFRLMAGIARSEQARLGEQRYEPEARALLTGAANYGGLDTANRAKAWIGLAELALRAAQDEEGVQGSEKERREHLAEAERQLELVRGATGGGACLEGFDAANLNALEGILGLARVDEPNALAILRDKTVSSLTKMLGDWKRTPARKGGIGYLHMSYRRMLLRVAMQLELAVDPVHGGERAIEHFLRAQESGTLLRDLNAGSEQPSPSLGQIRTELLSDHKGILMILPSKYSSLVFAFDGEGPVVSKNIVRDDELEEPMALLRSALQRPFTAETPESLAAERTARATEVGAAAGRLRDLVLPSEILSKLRTWTAMTVVGSEYLEGIPIEILPLGDAGDEPIGQRLAVDIVPSLPAQWLLRARALKDYPSDADLEFLAAAFVPELFGTDALSSRKAVVEALHVGTEPGTALLGHEATPEGLIESMKRLGHVDYLQLFVHGDYDYTKERGASLELSSGERSGKTRIDSNWVETHGVVGRLVFLSACGSAAGPPRLGDDNLAHLGGAFLVAGAECVILSRSKLELEQTLMILKSFHTAIAGGASPAEAMRRARVVGQANDPTGWATYSGGGLQVFGHGHSALVSAEGGRER